MSKIKFHLSEKRHWLWNFLDIILLLFLAYLLYKNWQSNVELTRVWEICQNADPKSLGTLNWTNVSNFYK